MQLVFIMIDTYKQYVNWINYEDEKRREKEESIVTSAADWLMGDDKALIPEVHPDLPDEEIIDVSFWAYPDKE